MFMARIEPTDKDGEDRHTFECVSCDYAEKTRWSNSGSYVRASALYGITRSKNVTMKPDKIGVSCIVACVQARLLQGLTRKSLTLMIFGFM